MTTKLNDQFHDTLISQYKDMIHEAVLECDHLLFLDEELFNQKLGPIYASAKLDGLNTEDIHILVEAAKLEVTVHKKAG